MALSVSAQRHLCEYLERVNQNEKEQEAARQTFCGNSYFQLQVCFHRMDKFKKGHIVPSDIMEFMLENQIVADQEEIFLVFRDFDKHRRGKVLLEEFTDSMLPRENAKLSKEVLKRKPYDMVVRLDSELQFQLGKYFLSKLKGFKIRTKLVDELYRSNFDCLKGFRVLAKKGSIGGSEEIDDFLRKNGKVLKNQDFRRILTSLRFNAKTPVTFQNFQDHLVPMQKGFYPAYRYQLANRMEQKTKYQNIVRARNLLQKQKVVNRIEADELHLQHSLLRNHNLERSRIAVQQDFQRRLYDQEAVNNLRMSRQVMHQSREIAELARWRSKILDQEYTMMTRQHRLYGL